MRNSRLRLPRRRASVPAKFTEKKATKKIVASVIPRNPLISLVSVERIQEKPRQSNSDNRWVSLSSAADQENPNGHSAPARVGAVADRAALQRAFGRTPVYDGLPNAATIAVRSIHSLSGSSPRRED